MAIEQDRATLPIVRCGGVKVDVDGVTGRNRVTECDIEITDDTPSMYFCCLSHQEGWYRARTENLIDGGRRPSGDPLAPVDPHTSRWATAQRAATGARGQAPGWLDVTEAT